MFHKQLRAMVHGAVCVVGVSAFLIPPSAYAVTCGTALSPLSVSATGVNFGSYDALSSSAIESEGSVVVACQLSLDLLPAFKASLSRGMSNNFASRTMTSSGSLLTYNLYTNASHTIIWGDGTGDTETQSYDGLLVLGNVELTIYGVLPPAQFVPAGAYADTIIATIEY
jgi:spore coat protein U-like protein